MAQDLRKIFEEERKKETYKKLPEGHQARFEERMEKSLRYSNQPHSPLFFWLKIAAVLAVIISAGVFIFQYKSSPVHKNNPSVVKSTSAPNSTKKESPVYLSDISPEFKKVEDYYLANIHAELAQLDVTPANKELIDSFMAQLAQLNKDYKHLNADLDESGVNETTVSNLITNLQLRLDLLLKLKKKLAEIRNLPPAQLQGNNI